MKVYVLFKDYDWPEGCDPPDSVTTSLEEAEAWQAKSECNTYTEFELKTGLHCGMPSCRVCNAQFIA